MPELEPSWTAVSPVADSLEPAVFESLSSPVTLSILSVVPAAMVSAPKMPRTSSSRSRSPSKLRMNSWSIEALMAAESEMFAGTGMLAPFYL